MKHIKYIFASLKEDFSKLIAIILIVLLGIGFMSGLLQTGEDIQGGQDKFYEISKTADIRLSFGTGISKNVAAKIKDNTNADISFEYSYESNLRTNNSSSYSLIYERDLSPSAPDNLVLVEGNLPTSKNECVIMTGNSNFTNYEIGQKFTFDDKDEEYIIVGKVQSAEYITKQIVSSLTSGRRLQAILYFDISYFEHDYYTSMNFYYNIPCSSFSDDYFDQVDKYINDLKNYINDNDLINESFKDVARIEVQKETDKYLKNYLGSQGFEEYKSTDSYLKMIEDNTTKALYSYIQENGDIDSFYLTKNENYSYYMLKQDIDKVAAVSKIFPVFFFLIAMLVASSSIARIIAKDRKVMGTFKGLGMSNKKISNKYFSYGFFALLIGSAAGLLLGLFALTYVIYYCYVSIYYLPYFVFKFNILYIFIILGLMFVFIFGVILYNSYFTLKEKPVELMQDKAPKPGKKLLLEKIKPLWKVLPFRFKNMFRNVFRYKKNLIMMIIGVGGSIALVLTAFGMRDSITVLTDDQFNKIFNYNFIVETKNYEKISSNFERNCEISYYSGSKINNESAYSFTLISGDKIDEFINFEKDFNSSSAFITKNLAEHFNIKENTSITFSLDNKNYEVYITGTVNNYVGNYLYLGSDYQKQFKANALMGYKDTTDLNINEFNELLFEDDSVSNIVYIGDSVQVYDSLLNNLNMIVFILIILSGLLMITVIYNLVDINISNRKKEIATLKVLGYHKKELILYIFREILLMTFISVLFGLLSGYFLHGFVISAINSPGLTFGTTILFKSYIYSILLTIIFTFIVTIILSPKILKIDMVESLKSVD